MEESKNGGKVLEIKNLDSHVREHMKAGDSKIGQWIICLRFGPDAEKVGIYMSGDAPDGKVTLPQGHITEADARAAHNIVRVAANRILSIKLGIGCSKIRRDIGFEHLVSFRVPCPARLEEAGFTNIDYHVVVSMARTEEVSPQNGSQFTWEDPELVWTACGTQDDTYLSPCKRMMIGQALMEFVKQPREFHRALHSSLRDTKWFQRIFRNLNRRIAA